jgi:type II secretory pathway predicted ATPase ExeA
VGLISLLSPRLWLALLVAAVLAMSHAAAYRAGGRSVQAKWNVEKLAQAQQAEQALVDARKRETALQATVAQLRSRKDADTEKLRGDLDRALEQLRQRPERPADYLPVDAGAGQFPGCGADRLFREDADDLVRLAAEADTLRIAYGQCQAQYNAARSEINGTQPGR